MAETTMPAAEVAVDASHDEKSSYEFAFHILPTVAEGEVPGVFESLKDTITQHKGELLSEEPPERFDLAYEIVQHIEGKNRKFNSAYFGWIRFTSSPEAVVAITQTTDSRTDILRYLLIKLTKVEEEQPFFFHQALKEQKTVTTVEESKVIPDLTTVASTDEVSEEIEAKKTEEENVEVDEDALEEALEKEEKA